MKIGQQIEDAEIVIAPDFLIPECVNAIWKEHQFGGLSLAICDEVFAVLPRLIDILVPSMELHREAFHLSRTSRRPAYDMFYLALAKREDAVLVTLDASLRKEAARQGIRVH
jgi:predicted nucleic acid-binding protein